MPERAYVVRGGEELLADALRTLLEGFKQEGLDIEELAWDDVTAGSVV